MQMKRTLELAKDITADDSNNIQALMTTLQRVAFDIVSYNVGSAIYCAQIESYIDKSPATIEEILDFKTDFPFDDGDVSIFKQGMKSYKKTLADIGGQCGDLLQTLEQEVWSKAGMKQAINGSLQKYQSVPPRILEKEDDGSLGCSYSQSPEQKNMTQ